LLLVVCLAVLGGGALGWAWFLDRDTEQAIRTALGLEKKPLTEVVAPLVGEAAPDCSFHDLQGGIVHLRDFVGRVPVVVEFGGFT
jgi:hypothetical protein